MPDSDRVTRAELGRLAEMSESNVRYHIAQGLIAPGPDGMMSRADVALLRGVRNVVAFPAERSGHRLIRSKMQAAAVKIRGLEFKIRTLQSQTVERSAVEAGVALQTAVILDHLRSWPDRYAEHLASRLGIDSATARDILQRFSTLALAELGDIHAEALAALR